jgi:serine/threonine-protein kinase
VTAIVLSSPRHRRADIRYLLDEGEVTSFGEDHEANSGVHYNIDAVFRHRRCMDRQLRFHLLSPETGATGWSFSYGNRRDAERKAQRSCNENADDCRVAIWFKNGCGAVAVGDDGWGSGWGYSRREARRQAIASCDQRTESCSVVRWQCSGQE